MCLNVATSTCVAPPCDGAPRALGSLLFDFICHFLHIVGFPSPHPSPVPGWTGPVPGRAEWQHVGLSCQMPPTTAGLPVPPGCHLHGSGLLCSRLCRTAASSRGWELQCCLPGGGGGAQGCGWGWGTAVGRASVLAQHISLCSPTVGSRRAAVCALRAAPNIQPKPPAVTQHAVGGEAVGSVMRAAVGATFEAEQSLLLTPHQDSTHQHSRD